MSQRDVPVMLVTVVGGEPLRQVVMDAGIIDFIVKPSVRANWCCLRAWRDWQASAKTPTCAQASVFEQASAIAAANQLRKQGKIAAQVEYRCVRGQHQMMDARAGRHQGAVAPAFTQ